MAIQVLLLGGMQRFIGYMLGTHYKLSCHEELYLIVNLVLDEFGGIFICSFGVLDELGRFEV